MNVHVVIPARMASTRLPDKPLADINGRPMVVAVAQQAAKASVSSVTVAVDHQDVYDAVATAGHDVLMTREDHPAGSDRVMEVVHRQGWPDDDVVINVQGDEPLMPPAVVNFLAQAMQQEPGLQMATLAEPISRVEDFLDPNVVKVICDHQGRALYFSRATVPYPRDAGQELQIKDIEAAGALRHVGVYAFRVAALRNFVGITGSRLEAIERLEQLRWLEAGNQIKVLLSPQPVPGGIDTPHDLQRVRELLS